MFVTVVDQCRNVLNIEKCPMDQFILRAQIVLSIKDQKHLHDFMGKPEDVWIAENLPNYKYVDHLCLALICNYLSVNIRTIQVSKVYETIQGIFKNPCPF